MNVGGGNGDDSDEEFSLRDVDAAKAVGDILEGEDSQDEDDDDDDEDGEDVVGHNDNIFASDGDPDSVQVRMLDFSLDVVVDDDVVVVVESVL